MIGKSNLSGTQNNTQGGQSVWETRSTASIFSPKSNYNKFYTDSTQTSLDSLGILHSLNFFPFVFSFGSPGQSLFPGLIHRTSTHTHLYTQFHHFSPWVKLRLAMNLYSPIVALQQPGNKETYFTSNTTTRSCNNDNADGSNECRGILLALLGTPGQFRPTCSLFSCIIIKRSKIKSRSYAWTETRNTHYRVSVWRPSFFGTFRSSLHDLWHPLSHYEASQLSPVEKQTVC